MYDIPILSANKTPSSSLGDTTPIDFDPDPADVWLFTDPAAREAYLRQGRLEQAEYHPGQRAASPVWPAAKKNLLIPA